MFSLINTILYLIPLLYLAGYVLIGADLHQPIFHMKNFMKHIKIVFCHKNEIINFSLEFYSINILCILTSYVR